MRRIDVAFCLVGAFALAAGITATAAAWLQSSIGALSCLWVPHTPATWLMACALVGFGILSFWYGCSRCSLKKCCSWVTAANIDKPSASAGEDGTSAFVALATFALAEGGALTVVAKGEGHDQIVLMIYGIVVVFSLGWIIAMLRSTTAETVANETRMVHAYNSISLRYGRITLAWTVVLSFIMIFLALNELLPNQTPRIEFDLSEVSCEPLNFSDWQDPAGPVQKRMDKWIERISATTRQVAQKEEFFLVKQKSPFPNSYKPFSLDLACNPKFVLGERSAFLVHTSPSEYRPSYRQVPFRNSDNAQTAMDTCDLPDANKDEYLVVFVFVRDVTKAELPTKATVGIKSLTPHLVRTR